MKYGRLVPVASRLLLFLFLFSRLIAGDDFSSQLRLVPIHLDPLLSHLVQEYPRLCL